MLINCYSIQLFLQQLLLNSIRLNSEKLTDKIGDETLKILTTKDIPLYRLKDPHAVIYRCPIALSLAKTNNRLPIEIAEDLTQVIESTAELQVQVTSPGWVDLRLRDRALATWLQYLLDHPPQSSNRKVNSQNSNLFRIQYAHARCCSLLDMAHRQGFISLQKDNWGKAVQWLAPEIPWLSSNNYSETLTLRFHHPAERNLLFTLLQVTDAFKSLTEAESVKLAQALSEALLRFYDSCRIWGEVMQETPLLAQTRLGLLAITQIWLQWLLQEKLGMIAPWTL